MNLNGRRQSTNVESRTGNGTYDGNGNRIHGYGESGQLTRNGKTYNSNYDARGKTYGGSSSSSSRVICTHFFKKGMLERDVWKADLSFTFQNLSAQTIRGYHFWAIPYVRLMRKSRVAEAIMYPIAKARAEELAYQMGMRAEPNFAGKLVRLIGEPICFGRHGWRTEWAGPLGFYGSSRLKLRGGA